jgi:hypothetical protein
MKNKLIATAVVAAFVTASTASWAYVGGNSQPKYPAGGPASTNKTVKSHGVGGNSMPSYPKAEGLSKNKTVKSHGVGGNSMPSYPKSGTH